MSAEELRLASAAQLRVELNKLLRERDDVLQRTLTPDQGSATWYSAQLRVIEGKIHQIRNKLFIAQNAL